MKKIYVVGCLAVMILVSFLGITYSYEYNESNSLKFELLGDYELNLSLYDKYVEYGVKVIYNGEDISSLVNIDDSMLNMNKVGEYKVKYEVNFDGIVEYVYRVVKVTENIKPEIVLKGDMMVYINLNESYIESGYEVTDNYDTDLNSKVNITSNLIVTKVGEYTIEYRVSDSSGNEAVAIREVIVR